MSVATVVRKALVGGALLASAAMSANAQTPNPFPFYGFGGNVSVRFVGSNAGDRSFLLYKIGGLHTDPGYTLLFINNGAGASAPGSQVNIGPVAAGTEVMFRLVNLTAGRTYYSGDPTRNPDGIAHVSSTNPSPSGGPAIGGGFYLDAFNFEDRFFPPADLDYNDLNFEIAGVRPSTSVVPEPASIVLMMSGLLGLGVVARRRKV